MDTDATVSKDKLVQDFKLVVADAEELLRATASQAGEKVNAARERVKDSLHAAKVKLAEAEDELVRQGKLAARAPPEEGAGESSTPGRARARRKLFRPPGSRSP